MIWSGELVLESGRPRLRRTTAAWRARNLSLTRILSGCTVARTMARTVGTLLLDYSSLPLPLSTTVFVWHHSALSTALYSSISQSSRLLLYYMCCCRSCCRTSSPAYQLLTSFPLLFSLPRVFHLLQRNLILKLKLGTYNYNYNYLLYSIPT